MEFLGIFALPIVAALAYSFGTLINNYLVDTYLNKNKEMPAALVVFAPVGLMIPITFLVISNGVEVFFQVNMYEAAGLMLAGVIGAMSWVPYFKAFREKEPTNITILMQFFPVFALIFGFMLLGQSISTVQIGAFCLIIGAALLLAVGVRTKRKRALEIRATALVVTMTFLWALSGAIYVLVARNNASVENTYIWFLVGMVLALILLILCKAGWRKTARSFLRTKKLRKLSIVGSYWVVYTVAEFAFRAALLAMPIAVASVVSSVSQLIITFILGLVLTLFLPKVGREELTFRTITLHLVAIVMVTTGVILIG
jgi:drug/metabolite transporter (DMT)-like permease